MKKGTIFIWLLLVSIHNSMSQSSTLSIAIQKCLPTVFIIKTYDAKGEEEGTGTGFFIDSIGTGITNYHVLKGAKTAKVFLSDGNSYKIIGTNGENKEHDIIRFSIQKTKVKYLKIASKQPQLGEDVFTIGNPKGLAFSAANGIISSIREEENVGRIIQTTAPISKGCSGSPLLNLKGDVLGVISFYIKDAQNLNFAFSAQYIKEIPITALNYSFPEEDIIDKTSQREENYFKKQDWYGTQYMIKSIESSRLISDKINSATSKPELKYLCKLAGKPYELTYTFESEIGRAHV